MLVSIVIPCYNVGAYIAEALESALAQDYRNIEIICVDNNSTDNTTSIINRYIRKYSDTIHLLSENKQNASAARNTGWRYSRGELIQFLDADDLLLTDKISRQTALFKSTTELIIGHPTYEDLNGNKVSLKPWKDPWKGLAHGMFCGQTSANLYSRSCLKKINGWNETLPDTQDTELMFRLLAANAKAILDQEYSCICRDRPSGKITQKNPQATLERHVQLRHQINQFLREERKDYWHKHQVFFHLALYRYLRMLAVHSIEKSNSLFGKYLPKSFRIQANRSLKIPRWNAMLVNTFGFANTEGAKNKLKHLFPRTIWLWLKTRLR